MLLHQSQALQEKLTSKLLVLSLTPQRLFAVEMTLL
jgi:hypothetical protein